MTISTTDLRGGRMRVSRSRGALSGVLLLVLGAWAALVPFIGPYFDFAFTPRPNDAWHWTSARGWLEVLPGGVAFVGGLLLLAGATRVVTLFGGWLAALGGAWLVVGPSLADLVNLDIEGPDPTSAEGVRALEALLFFYAIGGAILLFAGIALGRLSVHSVGDVRAADRRAAEEQRLEEERRTAAAAEQERAAAAAERDRAAAAERDRGAQAGPGDGTFDERRGVLPGQHADTGQRADAGPPAGPPTAAPYPDRPGNHEAAPGAPAPSEPNPPPSEPWPPQR